MNTAGRLGQLYNLSPATTAGLANVTGSPVPPEVAAYAQGLRTEQATPPPAGPPQIAHTMPAPAPQPSLFDRAAAFKPIPEEATPGVALQGPAPDGFPTVRTNFADQGVGAAAPAGPVRTIPGHWQYGSHAVTEQKGINPAALEEGQYMRDVAAGHEMLAADKRLEAAQKAGMADAIYASAHQMASQQANDRIAQINQQRAAYVASERQKLDQLATQAEKQVDPDAYWKARGTGAVVAGAVMMGLGEFAHLWTGRGGNTAKDMIDNAIQQNIDAQKTNVANARNALTARQSLYDRNLAEFGDQERAALATKVQYLDQVAGMIEAKRAEIGLDQQSAAYNDLIGHVYKERAAAADMFAEKTEGKVTEQMNEHYVPPATVGGGAGAKGKESLFVPTLNGYARDEKTAQKLNEKGALRMQIGENMHQIYQLMDKAKTMSSFGDYNELKQIDEQIQGLVNDSLTKNTVLEGQGAMSEGDKAVAAEAKALKDVSVQFTRNSVIERRQENVKKAATNMLTQHRLEGESYGVQKGSEQYVQGPNGPVPVQRLQGRNAAPTKLTTAVDDLVQPPKGVPQK